MYPFNFERLEVWKDARELVRKIYQLTESFPKTEEFGIKSQVRRAAMSICLNLAEGAGRRSRKDQARFYKYAYGSLMETAAALIIAEDLSFLETEIQTKLRPELIVLSKRISALENFASDRKQ